MSLVAIATCAGEAVDEHDSSLLTAALATRGIDARLVAWDAPGIDWDDHDLVVVRSTWDYTERLEEFVAWARSVPRLANPAEVLVWNTDKHYLADLAAAGGGVALEGRSFMAAMCLRIVIALRPKRSPISFAVTPAALQHSILVFSSIES